MANAQTTQQPTSDDQELAKVLAGVNQDASQAEESGSGMTFEPTGTPPSIPTDDATATPADDPSVVQPTTDNVTSLAPEPTAADTLTPNLEVTPAPAASGELDGIKLEALNELRPLVDKLEVSPEEKFDTYLLLLRSTDDKELIAPAHEAAKNIVDETRRAQALLDIIKEIDFLSGSKQ